MTRPPLTPTEILTRLAAGQPVEHIRRVATYRRWPLDAFAVAAAWSVPDEETVYAPYDGHDPDREHGTERGHRQHRKYGEKPCEPCREARNERERDRQRKAS